MILEVTLFCSVGRKLLTVAGPVVCMAWWPASKYIFFYVLSTLLLINARHMDRHRKGKGKGTALKIKNKSISLHCQSPLETFKVSSKYCSFSSTLGQMQCHLWLCMYAFSSLLHLSAIHVFRFRKPQLLPVPLESLDTVIGCLFSPLGNGNACISHPHPIAVHFISTDSEYLKQL